MDVGLFEYDLPVIKYYPRNANMSSSSVTIQLNDVIHVEHIFKFSKPNVLMIEFPLHSMLLSFKSKERMEMWMSELLCLTSIEFFTHLKIMLVCIPCAYKFLRGVNFAADQ